MHQCKLRAYKLMLLFILKHALVLQKIIKNNIKYECATKIYGTV